MPEEMDYSDYLIDRIHDLLDKKEYNQAAVYAERLKKVGKETNTRELAIL